MRKNRVGVLSLSLALTMLLSACGDASHPAELVGTWETDGGGRSVRLELRADGTYSELVGFPAAGMMVPGEGTWTASGRVVSLSGSGTPDGWKPHTRDLNEFSKVD